MTAATGAISIGYWNPLALAAAFLLILALVYIIRALGNKENDLSRGKKTGQAKPFISGNLEEGDAVRSQDIFWGFLDALKIIYRPLMRYHTGIVNDYAAAFVIVLAILFVLILTL